MRRAAAVATMAVAALTATSVATTSAATPARAGTHGRPAVRRSAVGNLIWSEPVLMDTRAPSIQPRALTSVDCPSRSLCVAVDTGGLALTASDPAQQPGSWHARRVAGTVRLAAVSCASRSLCAAVGSGGTLVATTHPAGAWHKPLRTAGGKDLDAVACPTEDRCLAVSAATLHAYVISHPGAAKPRWRDLGSLYRNAPRFTIPTAVSCPSASTCVVSGYGSVTITHDAGARKPGWHVLAGFDDVSCPSVTTCLSFAANTSATRLWRMNPSQARPRWKAVSGAAPTDDSHNAIKTISCPSATMCAIGDTAGKVTVATDTKGSPFHFGPMVSTFIPKGTVPNPVACADANLCAAVDAAGQASATTDPTAAAPSWSAATVIDHGSRGALTGVACATATRCLAVDHGGNAFAVGHLGARYAFPSWRATHIDDTPLTGISCAASRLCMAIDAGGRAVVTRGPAASSIHWRAPAAIDPGAALTAVSCPSAGFCAAADQDGRVLTTVDPAAATPTWTAPRQIARSGRALQAISCASASLCYAVDDHKVAYATTTPGRATRWRIAYTSHDAGCPGTGNGCNGPSDADCPTASECALGTDLGEALITDTPRAPRPRWRAVQAGAVAHLGSAIDNPAAIACVGIRLCAYVDRNDASAIWHLGARKPAVSRRLTAVGPADITPPSHAFAVRTLRRVACASARTCIAVDANGEISVGNINRRAPNPLAATFGRPAPTMPPTG